MSSGFTIGAASAASTIFQCPNCNETIDSSAESCRFCGSRVDHEAALKAAAVLSKVNQACSDATYMRSTALAIPVFFVLRFLPIVSMIGFVGFFGLLFAVPIWAIIWWLRYGNLSYMNDAEFARARTSVTWTGVVVGALFMIFVVGSFALGLLAGLSRR
jgi:hypothetical protein